MGERSYGIEVKVTDKGIAVIDRAAKSVKGLSQAQAEAAVKQGAYFRAANDGAKQFAGMAPIIRRSADVATDGVRGLFGSMGQIGPAANSAMGPVTLLSGALSGVGWKVFEEGAEAALETMTKTSAATGGLKGAMSALGGQLSALAASPLAAVAALGALGVKLHELATVGVEFKNTFSEATFGDVFRGMFGLKTNAEKAADGMNKIEEAANQGQAALENQKKIANELGISFAELRARYGDTTSEIVRASKSNSELADAIRRVTEANRENAKALGEVKGALLSNEEIQRRVADVDRQHKDAIKSLDAAERARYTAINDAFAERLKKEGMVNVTMKYQQDMIKKIGVEALATSRTYGEAMRKAGIDVLAGLETVDQKMAKLRQHHIDFINTKGAKGSTQIGEDQDQIVNINRGDKGVKSVLATLDRFQSANVGFYAHFIEEFKRSFKEGNIGALGSIVQSVKDMAAVTQVGRGKDEFAKVSYGLEQLLGEIRRMLGVPKRALGGPVSAGQSYMVGERGPERFVPQNDGKIVPTGAGFGMANGDTIALLRIIAGSLKRGLSASLVVDGRQIAAVTQSRIARNEATRV